MQGHVRTHAHGFVELRSGHEDEAMSMCSRVSDRREGHDS